VELLNSGITEQFTLTKPAGEGQEQQQPADLQEEAAFSMGKSDFGLGHSRV
jgi:hypothetical protein